jgi:hypothetical protein
VHVEDGVEFGQRVVFDGKDGAVVAGVIDEDVDPALSSDSVRAVRKTAAPSSAKRRAMARPMPRPEPVMRATWSWRSMRKRG